MINIEGLWKYDDAQRQISILAKLNSRMISDIGKLTKENTKLKQQAEGARTENKRLTRENDVLDMDYKSAKEHAQVAWERLAAMQHELNRLEAELDKEKKKNSRVKWVYDIDLHCYAPTDAPVQELMKHIPLIPVTVNEKEETDDDNERNA